MNYSNSRMLNPVSYDLDELIQRAKSVAFPIPNLSNYATATAFASWVFSLSHPNTVRLNYNFNETFSIAKKQEIEIQKAMSGFDGIDVLPSYQFKNNNWEMVYVDPLTDSGSAVWFEAPSLCIAGHVFHCRPDVVLYNDRTLEILIIERKVAVTAVASIPEQCYPNVLAQLWVYSHIDCEQAKWPVAKGKLLGAAIWSRARNDPPGSYNDRSNWLWRANNSYFKKIEILFRIYSELVLRS